MTHLDAAFRSAVAEELRPVLDELRRLRAEVAELRTVATPPTLEPLAAILGTSKPAALARISRDPELRALGLKCGRSFLYRRAEVEALYAARQRAAAGLRIVEGSR